MKILDVFGNLIEPESEYVLYKKIGDTGWSGIRGDFCPIEVPWGEARVYKGLEIPIRFLDDTEHAKRWCMVWDIVPLGKAAEINEMKNEQAVFDLYTHPMPLVRAQKILARAGGDDPRFYNLVRFQLRLKVIDRYGFAIPCTEAINRIECFGPMLEVGAGSGYWSKLVNARTVSGTMIPTDLGLPIADGYGKFWDKTGIVRMDAVSAVRQWTDRNVFVSWPSCDEGWAARMAKEIQSG